MTAVGRVVTIEPLRSGWWHFLRGARWGLLLSMPVGALIVLDEFLLMGLSFLLVIPYFFVMLVAFMLSALTAPLLLCREDRRRTQSFFGAVGTFAMVAFASLLLSEVARMAAFARVARSAEPLVAALREFTRDEGRAPESLDELVPAYIERVPRTLGSAGRFKYRRHASGLTPSDVTTKEPLDTGPWSLILPCGRGVLNWDVFVYWPTEQYPHHMYGGFVERVRSWAYVHE